MRAKKLGQSALLLLDVIDVLDALHIPYAIIGAFAASFYGVVRGSADADAVISLSSGQANLETLIDALHKAGLKSTRSQGELRDPIKTAVHISDQFENRVDLLIGIRGMSEEAFSRTIEAVFAQTRVRVIGIEDFIAMKLFAGSLKDIEDAAGVLRVSSNRIRLSLLEDVVQPYGKDAVRKLQALLRDTR